MRRLRSDLRLALVVVDSRDRSYVDRAEKLRAADQVVALTGLRAPANDNTVAPTVPASGGSGGGLN